MVITEQLRYLPDLLLDERPSEAGQPRSRKRRRRPDRGVPDGRREDDEQQRETQVRRDAPAPQDDQEEKDHRSSHEHEVEHEEQEGAHITLCSRTSWPDLKRDALSGLMSSEVLPSTMS